MAKGFFGLLATALCVITSVTLSRAQPVEDHSRGSSVMTRSVPLHFTMNLGQWDERVLFHAVTDGATLWFTADGIILQFAKSPSKKNVTQTPTTASESEPDYGAVHVADRLQYEMVTVRFIGANPDAEVVPEVATSYRSNFFLGDDPSKWRTDVPSYAAVAIKGIYPGIDIRYSADVEGQPCYQLELDHNADISKFEVTYDGGAATSSAELGMSSAPTSRRVEITDISATISGSVPLLRRHARAASRNDRARLPSQLKSGGDDGTAERTASRPTSLAVVLAYSTFLGGGGDEKALGIAVDGHDNAYVTGYTDSYNFPANDPPQEHSSNTDAFVVKLSREGDGLVYCTFLGGNGADYGKGIAIDKDGYVCVVGTTRSKNLPTVNALQTTFQGGSTDAFVARLSGEGNQLEYGSYLGGELADEGSAIAVDPDGQTYVTGWTNSHNFPVNAPYQQAQGETDAFVVRLDMAGGNLIYATYLGGELADFGHAIAVDALGNACVTGMTSSSRFPTQNAIQPAFQGGRYDLFVSKFTAFGNELAYSTYLGGDAPDYGAGIAVDSTGCAYVTGATMSAKFPIVNAFQEARGDFDAFVVKLSAGGDSLVYSTLVGGAAWDHGKAIAVDEAGNAYVTGMTYSRDFPIRNSLQARFIGGASVNGDAFVTKLTNSGGSLAYSTFLGGHTEDFGLGIAVDRSGGAYVTGWTKSPYFPIEAAVQPELAGGSDAFVTKLREQSYLCGDVDNSGEIDIEDARYLVRFIFNGGPEPFPPQVADCNCNGLISVGDVVCIAMFVQGIGAVPGTGCL